MKENENIKKLQRLLIGHGALLIFLGGVLGFGFLFFLLGKVTLWPFPNEIDYQIPGTYDGWRMAHLEAIINGILFWLTASLLPVLPLTAKMLKHCSYWIIIVGWTFVIASTIDPLFPESRGLAFGGPLTNNIAFFLFYIGVVAIMAVMALIAYRSFKHE